MNTTKNRRTRKTHTVYEAKHVTHVANNVVHNNMIHAQNQHRDDKQTCQIDKTSSTQHNDNNINMTRTTHGGQEGDTENKIENIITANNHQAGDNVDV